MQLDMPMAVVQDIEAMSELERAILDVLRAADGWLSSSEIASRLPRPPRGKNGTCNVLKALLARGLVVRTGGASKKFSRYAVSRCGSGIYAKWPFVPMRRD